MVTVTIECSTCIHVVMVNDAWCLVKNTLFGYHFVYIRIHPSSTNIHHVHGFRTFSRWCAVISMRVPWNADDAVPSAPHRGAN